MVDEAAIAEESVLDEITRLSREGGASPDALRWLAAARSRSRRLVFRDAGRGVAGAPTYVVGLADSPVVFSPPVRQIESVRYLYLLAKQRGSYVALPFGEPGKRRAEAARKRLLHAVEVLAEAAPELADELRRLEVSGTDEGQKVLARLPWLPSSPVLQV